MAITYADSVLNKTREIKAVLTSNASGAATATTDRSFSGPIVKAVIVPASGGSAPTNLFDLTVTDKNGVDILEGNGADCSSTTPKYLDQSEGLGWMTNSSLTFNLSNAGDSKVVTVVLTVAE